MNKTKRRPVLTGIVALLMVLAALSVWFLKWQIDSFDPKRLMLRAPTSDIAPKTQTLSTFTYRDEAGQEQTLVMQVQYRPSADEPESENAPEPVAEDQAKAGSAALPHLYNDAAAAASFRTQTTIAILGVALLFAAAQTGAVACCSVHDITKCWHKIRTAVFAGTFALAGGLLVQFDPVGPVVSHDIDVLTFLQMASPDGLLVKLNLEQALG